MPRQKKANIFEIKCRILGQLTAYGYDLNALHRLNRADPDHETPILLFDAYTALRQLEVDLDQVRMELTMKEYTSARRPKRRSKGGTAGADPENTTLREEMPQSNQAPKEPREKNN